MLYAFRICVANKYSRSEKTGERSGFGNGEVGRNALYTQKHNLFIGNIEISS